MRKSFIELWTRSTLNPKELFTGKEKFNIQLVIEMENVLQLSHTLVTSHLNLKSLKT